MQHANHARAYALIAALLTGMVAVPAPAGQDDSTRVSTEGHEAQGPEISLGPDGAINMVWIDTDPNAGKHDTGGHGHSHMATTNLYFARSTDGGQTFAPAVRVNAVEGDVWGFTVSKPRVVAGANGTIHVFYPGNDVNPANGKPHAVAMYTRSTDGGKSFATPQRLNTMPTSDASHLVHGGLTHAHVFGTMAVDGRGTVYTMWIDTRDMQQEGDSGKVFLAVSTDDGKTFSTDREIYPADVCPCCQLTAFVDERDRLFVGSRQVDGKYRDSVVSLSVDRGATFSARQRLSPNRWAIDGCPLKPTALAASGDQVWAAYFSAGEATPGVHFVRSDDGGKTFSAPVLVHPEAAVSDAPVLALAGNVLHLFWHAKVGDGGRRVFTRSSTDGGRTFGAVAQLPAPAGSAQLPVVAARSDGTVQVAWQQGREIHSIRWPRGAELRQARQTSAQ
ncbi:MAG: sialidase family protein [Steroidobacteraceae bacterium]